VTPPAPEVFYLLKYFQIFPIFVLYQTAKSAKMNGLAVSNTNWRLAQTEEPSGNPPIDEYLSKDNLEAKAAKISLIEGVSIFLSLCFYFFEINLNLV
jgi:hypothetical protein